MRSPLWKTCTMVWVERTSTFFPMNCHGTEYRVRPILMWMSGPTVARDHFASTNVRLGSGASASFSFASNTTAGAAPPSGRHCRCPATSTDHRSAARCICSIEVNSRPRHHESRIYGIGLSTRPLSRGFRDRAGSTRAP